MLGLSLRCPSVRNTIVVAVVCVLLALSQSANMYTFWDGHVGTWGLALALTAPTWALIVLCAPVIAWLVRTYTFAAHDRARSATIHVLSGLLFAFVHNASITIIYSLLLADHTPALDTFADRFRVTLSYMFYQDVLAYGVLLATFLALHYADLRAQLAEARLTALRAQLNPHFFFNTLNAVSTLALQGRRDDVAEIVGRLGDLMRTALHAEVQEVSLSTELVFVEDYLAIQRVRFGDRLQVQKTIARGAFDAAVPSLVLQPILENAVEYGLARDGGPILVTITAARCDEDLLVEVTDTGPGFAADMRREGIGLTNTRARLRELYGNRCRFEYGNLSGGGASVRISIPFRSVPDTGDTVHEDGLDALNTTPEHSEDRGRVARFQT